MRRNYYKEHYSYEKVRGTLTTNLANTFFNGGIFLPQEIILDDEDVVYYEKLNGEQINFNVERENAPKVFSSNQTKLDISRIQPLLNKELTIKNETLNNLPVSSINELDVWQESDFSGEYQLSFNQRNLLLEYIFAKVKEMRIFESLLNSETKGTVNEWIKNWIKDNIINLYRLKDVALYIDYRQLSNSSDNNKIGLNRWKTDTTTKPTLSNVRWQEGQDIVYVEWKMEEDYLAYNMDYYYIPTWEKIVGNI